MYLHHQLLNLINRLLKEGNKCKRRKRSKSKDKKSKMKGKELMKN